MSKALKEVLKRHFRSSFTKKGPGVRAQLASFLGTLTQEELQIMQLKGWDQGLLRKTSTGKLRCCRE